MAPITSSFIADIQKALVAELRRAMGVDDAEDFPDPEYLRLKVVDTGNPVQTIQYPIEQLPSAKIAFASSRPTEDAIGADTEFHRQELFLVYLTARFNGSLMGLDPGFSGSDLIDAANASMHELVQRSMHVLRELVPSITDATWKWSTNFHRIGRFAVYLDHESKHEITGKAWFEYIMDSAKTN